MWQRVLDSVSDAVITTDVNFVVRGWNRGAMTIYGWTKAEAIGAHVSERVRQVWESEHDRQAAIDAITREGAGGARSSIGRRRASCATSWHP